MWSKWRIYGLNHHVPLQWSNFVFSHKLMTEEIFWFKSIQYLLIWRQIKSGPYIEVPWLILLNKLKKLNVDVCPRTSSYPLPFKPVNSKGYRRHKYRGRKRLIGIKLQELVPFWGRNRSSSPLDPFFPISSQSRPMTSALPTSPSIKERPCFVVQPTFDSNISAKTTKSSNISEFPVRIGRGQTYLGWHYHG